MHSKHILKDTEAVNPNSPGQPADPKGEFARCRWFTRGWTLQELIAPPEIYFYNATWKRVGTKSKLWRSLSHITGVQQIALEDPRRIFGNEFSVARKMSWAANRSTSRKEDIAYCLLGIFNVNMPLLYGEGLSAFTRLQEEIIKISNDQSLFAWEHADGLPSHGNLLASHPRNFSNGATIMQWRNCPALWKQSYTLTNTGLHVSIPLLERPSDRTTIAPLRCYYQDNLKALIGLPLTAQESGRSYHLRFQWPRLALTEDITKVDIDKPVEDICILHNRNLSIPAAAVRQPHSALVSILPPDGDDAQLVRYSLNLEEFSPREFWSLGTCTFVPKDGSHYIFEYKSNGKAIYGSFFVTVTCDGQLVTRDVVVAFGYTFGFINEPKGYKHLIWLQVLRASRGTIFDAKAFLDAHLSDGEPATTLKMTGSLLVDDKVRLEAQISKGTILSTRAMSITVKLVHDTASDLDTTGDATPSQLPGRKATLTPDSPQ